MTDHLPIGTDEQSKAVASVAEMGTESIKAATKAASWVAKIVQDVPGDLIGVLGGDWLHQKRQRTLASLVAATEACLEDIAANRRTEPSPALLLPLLTVAADESREALQALWASLLANTMLDGGKRVRKDIFATVTRLEPLDAMIFVAFCETSNDPTDGTPDERAIMNAVSRKLGEELSQLDYQVSVQALIRLECLGKRTGTYVTQYGRFLKRAITVE